MFRQTIFVDICPINVLMKCIVMDQPNHTEHVNIYGDTEPCTLQVSAMKDGLLPISHEGMIIGDASYFEYTGLLVDQEERDKLARTLGPASKILFLRNHGVCALGESIEEAFYLAQNVMSACDSQVPYPSSF